MSLRLIAGIVFSASVLLVPTLAHAGDATPVTPTAPPANPAAATSPIDDSSPEALITSVVHALRTNDLAAFFHHQSEAVQQTKQADWAKFTANPNFNEMIERRLAQLAPDKITSDVTALLTKQDVAKLAEHLHQFANPSSPEALAAAAAQPPGGGGPGGPGGFGGPGGPGGPGGFGGFGGRGDTLVNWVESLSNQVVTDSLAAGQETTQSTDMQKYLEALAGWSETVTLNTPDKITTCANELSAAFTALAIKTPSDLSAMTISDFYKNAGPAFAHVKNALATYDLNVDAALDTVKVASVKPLEGSPDTAVATITFTAFAAPQSTVLKLVKKDGHWSVQADSPLNAWLRRTMTPFQLLTMGTGGRGNGGGRRRQQGGANGAGGNGQPPATAPVTPPAPAPNPGF